MVGGLGAAFTVSIAIALAVVALTQREIDRHSHALSSARDAIARFVSRRVRTSSAGAAHTRRRSMATVLFLDIRDFPSFAETASPEETAMLVGSVAEIGFAAVLAHGGDVDRLT